MSRGPSALIGYLGLGVFVLVVVFGLLAVIAGLGQITNPVHAVYNALLHAMDPGTIGGDATRSLDKVYKAVRTFVGRLAKALDNALELELVLDDMRKTFQKTCRRDKRSKTGTFEMLSNIDLLDYSLT